MDESLRFNAGLGIEGERPGRSAFLSVDHYGRGPLGSPLTAFPRSVDASPVQPLAPGRLWSRTQILKTGAELGANELTQGGRAHGGATNDAGRFHPSPQLFSHPGWRKP